jgi:hypothetical protein
MDLQKSLKKAPQKEISKALLRSKQYRSEHHELY